MPAGHGIGHERAPQSHQSSGDHAQNDALAGSPSPGPGKTAVSFAIEDHCNQRAHNAPGQKQAAAFGLQDEVQHHSNHERDSNRNREGDRESRHVDCGHEQEIRQIENRSAYKGGDDVGNVRCLNVVHETGSVVATTSQGEGKDERNQKNANRVVPIKKLEAIILDALVGIGPGSPADGAGDHHQQRDRQIRRSEHHALPWKV